MNITNYYYKSHDVKYGYIGLFQTSINIKNQFIFNFCFVPNEAKRFGILLFKLIGFVFYTWGINYPKKCYISFRLYKSLEFRVGNGKKWLYIRCENLYSYKLNKKRRKAKFEL